MRQSVLSASVQMTKLGAVSDKPEADAAIQRDLDSLEKGADKNPMQFKKCKIWHWGRDNSRYQSTLGEASFKTGCQKRTWRSC